ncbi:MAG TPA: type I secretion system permease/ATPase [Comamonadaceae bacterium]|uniref:type I secretion system permease/ATPase n=1 Tax=Pulveribacter sp. TaxID=2678893 RepID=UPI000EBFE82A|nr:type I secretion system permease/ATPase [Pulveribacter sp.]HCL86672.1 type I secretion system permease/ATPase [Comamonadaceae bacterium]
MSLSSSGAAQRGEIARAVRGLRGAWAAVAVFSMVSNLMLLVPTLYMLQVYDRVLASGSELTLLAVSLIALFLFGAMAFADTVRARLLVRVGARLDAAVGARVFFASFARSVRDRQAQPAQPLADWTELRQFLTGPGIVTFFDLPWAPIYVAALFLLHPLLGVVALAFMLAQGALAWLGQRRTVAPALAQAQSQALSHGYLQGKLRNAEAVEAMGMLGRLQQRWLVLHAHFGARHAALQGLTHRVMAWSKCLRYAQQAASLAAGAILVIDGQLSPGGMIAANVLMARALAPIDQLVGVWRGLLGARAAYQRLADLLAAHPAQDEQPVVDAILPGHVQARGLSITAPGRSAPIVQGLDFEAWPGSLTVVLGASGSGKSTLARALVGAWPAEDPGSLLLDGQPLAAWSPSVRGPQTGYLPQDTALFAGTVAENIARFGDVDAHKVVAAAQCAGLHEMVLKLPKGYDTPVGEGARLLSGGQRQRIGLARALYGDPQLVVLDEPNAHLDDVGEAALLEALRQLKARGATVFLVTHRPGALALADQLLVLHDGRMQWQGPRDEVLEHVRAARAQAPAAPLHALPA